MKMIEIVNQKRTFLVGLNLVGDFLVKIRIARIKMEAANAITPPNLEGIERRIT